MWLCGAARVFLLSSLFLLLNVFFFLISRFRELEVQARHYHQQYIGLHHSLGTVSVI